MYNQCIKRIFDLFFSLFCLILISPLFIIITIFLSFANKGNPFFYQFRPGKNEKIFGIVKFKTMNDDRDAQGNLLPDSERLTTVGRFIRKTSMDELPQMINILKGDMSLIGPRPLLIKYLPFFSEKEKKRHLVRPGITGLAQVNGRNTVSWDQRLAYDVEYVENINFKTDLLIIFKTIRNVFEAKDIVIDPESIMKNLDDERRI